MKKRLLLSFIDVPIQTLEDWQKSIKCIKTLMLFVFFLCYSDTIVAQDYYLYLYSKDRTQDDSWEVSQVRKLTFSESEVIVYSPSGIELYAVPYDNVRKFTFQSGSFPTGLIQSDQPSFSLKYNVSHKALLVSGIDAGLLQLYSVNGTLVWSVQISDHRSVYPVTGLPNGIYIARLSNGTSHQTIKIIIQ